MTKKKLIELMNNVWGYDVETDTVERVKKNQQCAKEEYTEYRFWGVEREVGNRTLTIVVIDKDDVIHVVADDEAIAYGWQEEYFNH